MKLKEPEYPMRVNCYSDKQYLEAIRQYKTDRRKWLNQQKDRDPHDTQQKKELSKRRSYRNMKDSEFKKEQLEKLKQKGLF